jgi:hypothetical protein
VKRKREQTGEVAEFSFQAEVVKITTMESGALRVILDMPEHLVNIAAIFMECKRQGIPLVMLAKADV